MMSSVMRIRAKYCKTKNAIVRSFMVFLGGKKRTKCKYTYYYKYLCISRMLAWKFEPVYLAIRLTLVRFNRPNERVYQKLAGLNKDWSLKEELLLALKVFRYRLTYTDGASLRVAMRGYYSFSRPFWTQITDAGGLVLKLVKSGDIDRNDAIIHFTRILLRHSLNINIHGDHKERLECVSRITIKPNLSLQKAFGNPLPQTFVVVTCFITGETIVSVPGWDQWHE